MESHKSEKIAALLNISRGANIEGKELEGLIEDYFVSNNFEESDEDDSEDEEETSVVVEHLLPGPVPNQDDDEDEDSNIPLVEVQAQMYSVEVDPDVVKEKIKVSNWSCHCKMKVCPATPDDGRKGCITQLSVEELMTIRQDWSSKDVDVKDHFLCGLLLGQAINTSEKTCRTNKENKARKQSRTLYMYVGRSFCRRAFRFLVVISQRLLTSIKQHVLSSGAAERKKGKPGRNVKALTVADVERIVLFIRGFAETHGLVMPGRVNGFNRTDLKLLPSSHTKKHVHEQYKKAQTESGCYAVSIQTFKNEWSRYCPDVVVTRPMTDLCWVCQKNNTLIQHSANLPLDEKTQLIARQEHHLLAVTAERTYYQACVKASKDTAETNGITTLQQSAPCSRQMSFHYSFDYAQQVHIPSNPMQPGPIYFLVPRKCGIFGVNCEAIPQQVNFLIDEGMCSGKGSNAVISYLDFFFQNYGLGEEIVHLHCDNCAGQNKNQHLLHYLAWRVMTGRHKEIHLHFMLPGHTKFAPDWCFGLLKRKFRVSHVSSLQEMADCVRQSSERGINIPQLVGDEGGNVYVPTSDWQQFFGGIGRPFHGIKSLQHFVFSEERPGRCTARATLDGMPTEKTVLTGLPSQETPQLIPPPGLGRERREYLFHSIRQFVKPGLEDVVCPRP